ncbi:Hypothetical_protein [Hexamita inflata]|uniref:Hypothetical_protein n=1 Tax=Hexamita inflata TaxID=28002 RepID=A0AA86QFW5_9EUKA|nr:Hypothetical protein HINF_LOCUS38605 [Hexamita inflata]
MLNNNYIQEVNSVRSLGKLKRFEIENNYVQDFTPLANHKHFLKYKIHNQQIPTQSQKQQFVKSDIIKKSFYKINSTKNRNIKFKNQLQIVKTEFESQKLKILKNFIVELDLLVIIINSEIWTQ